MSKSNKNKEQYIEETDSEEHDEYFVLESYVNASECYLEGLKLEFSSKTNVPEGQSCPNGPSDTKPVPDFYIKGMKSIYHTKAFLELMGTENKKVIKDALKDAFSKYKESYEYCLNLNNPSLKCYTDMCMLIMKMLKDISAVI